MFADHVTALQQCVADRETALRQHRLNQRRWAVRRDILRGADNHFLEALKDEIARSHTPHSYSAVLKTYTVEELEAREPVNQTTLGEVLRGTDVLDRVANCLAPGHFRCHLRRERRRGLPELFHIDATFVSERFEAPRLPCTCVVHELTVGFCEVCGGHEVRPVMNPEDED